MQPSCRWILIAGLTLFAAAACHGPKDEPSDVIFTLDPEFSVDLFEQRDPATGAATFGFWIESMRVFNCANYQIRGSSSRTGDLLNIQLEEIQAPDTCMGAPGPARGFLPIGPLADGEYRFRVTRHIPIVNEGTLRVQNGHYELSIPEEQDIVFQNRVLEALPDGYLWGYALAPVEPDLPVADQFLDGLKPLTMAPDLAPGFYSYITVSGTGQYFFHRSIAPQGQHRPFLRRMSGSPDAVRNLLQGYRTDPSRPLGIRCYSTAGEW